MNFIKRYMWWIIGAIVIVVVGAWAWKKHQDKEKTTTTNGSSSTSSATSGTDKGRATLTSPLGGTMDVYLE